MKCSPASAAFATGRLAHGERRARAAAGEAANDDDIEIYVDDSRDEVAMTWRNLRVQTERPVVYRAR